MIAVRNVGFEVRNRKLLHDVSFDVEPGEFWAIVGANGAGKSTLIKLLSSELAPASALFFFRGRI
jgi:iron complex transport system ATP-binding protein